MGERPRKGRPGPRPRPTGIAEAAESPPAGEDPDGAPDADATQAGPPIAIEVTEGPDAGKRARVRGGRMVVGRGEGCDLRLRDDSTSRRHLEILAGMGGLSVRDLGSGNGTWVSGRRVEECAVAHGDEIVLGTTALRVIDELQAHQDRRQAEPPPEVQPDGLDEGTGNVAPSSRASGQRDVRRWAAMAVAGVAVLGAILVIAGLLRSPSVPSVKPPSERAMALFAKGRQALIDKDYDTALARFSEALRIDPSAPQLAEYRAHTQREQAAQAKLAMARKLLEGHAYDDARSALQVIPSDSDASDPAQALLKSLDGEQGQLLFDQAEAGLQAGDLDAAEGALARLVPLRPDLADRLTADLATRRQVLQRESAQEQVRAHAAAQRRQRTQRRRMDAAVHAELAPAYRKLRAGEYERAVRELEHLAEGSPSRPARARARELAKQVKGFAAAYAEAQRLEANGSFEAEAAPLGRAFQAWVQIDDEGSPLEDRLRQRLARALVLKGRSASARQDYGAAAAAFRKALDVRPGDAQAQGGIAWLRGRAHEVYLQGYEARERDPERARKLYTEVMQMLSPGEEDYQKAKRRLGELGNGTP